ncbi:MAG: cytochrome c biogenesis protein CcsA [Verrucomicrobiales bacterium]|nr:cytochrome c biogenesis protein CcsA [Verrucomicrobiales bacterium]
MEKLYLGLSTLCFLGGFIFAVTALRSGRVDPGRVNMAIIGLGFIFQCLFLQIRGKMHGQCPITSGAEVLVFICWSIVLMYFLLGKAFRLSLLGTFTAPIVFVFQGLALVFLILDQTPIERVAEVDAWKEMHASMALLSYGAFALSGVAGIMYFVQDRQLKSHHPGRLSYKLPPIRYLVDALVRLLGIGLLLLTIGIVSAFFMENFPSTLHLVVSGSVWVIYAGLLAVHLFKKLPPKRLAVSSVIAFVVAVCTLAAL